MDTANDTSIIRDYIQLVKDNYPAFKKAFLFGSFAKGYSNADSDIDIALIFEKLEDDKKFDLQVSLMLLATQIDNRIEPHPISAEDVGAGNPFIAEILESGVDI
jgi:predicted nucleotidyltransferase